MVAHSKQHKAVRQKNSHHLARKPHAGRLQAPPDLALLGTPVKEEDFAKDDEEPKPEDLAKEEEALKAEVEGSQALPEVEVDGHPEPRGRDRSSYDGDTAIKLYLREIGQVKLLTPQEEIELAARI